MKTCFFNVVGNLLQLYWCLKGYNICLLMEPGVVRQGRVGLRALGENPAGVATAP